MQCMTDEEYIMTEGQSPERVCDGERGWEYSSWSGRKSGRQQDSPDKDCMTAFLVGRRTGVSGEVGVEAELNGYVKDVVWIYLESLGMVSC